MVAYASFKWLVVWSAISSKCYIESSTWTVSITGNVETGHINYEFEVQQEADEAISTIKNKDMLKNNCSCKVDVQDQQLFILCKPTTIGNMSTNLCPHNNLRIQYGHNFSTSTETRNGKALMSSCQNSLKAISIYLWLLFILLIKFY